MLVKGRKVNTLYVIEAKMKKEDVNITVKDYKIETWHKMLGHISKKRLETLARKVFLCSFVGIFLKTCVHCLARKTYRIVFKSFLHLESRKSLIRFTLMFV